MVYIFSLFILFFLGHEDIRLIQISFDGNNETNPPNLMNDKIFYKIKVQWNIGSFINIVHTDEKKFVACSTNKITVSTLRSFVR